MAAEVFLCALMFSLNSFSHSKNLAELQHQDPIILPTFTTRLKGDIHPPTLNLAASVIPNALETSTDASKSFSEVCEWLGFYFLADRNMKYLQYG